MPGAYLCYTFTLTANSPQVHVRTVSVEGFPEHTGTLLVDEVFQHAHKYTKRGRN